ncbi:hypothetical protein [uncultured Corynebacterium sp.]|uniref:hypothetical protein n=1 Tax=uncultured Corynebacterium sp. TaxID=159447 RepID=UPI00261BC512|nr:hypothetical protein [uncultured Corynebacterium sp.]
MSLARIFPHSFDTKRAHYSAPLSETLAHDGGREANSVHYGRRINTQRPEITNDMSARDIVSMLSR